MGICHLLKEHQLLAYYGSTCMSFSKKSYFRWPIAIAGALAAFTVIGAQQLRKQTLAPHELNKGDAPPPIIRETAALPEGPINFESAEERHLRVVVVAKGLQQPWSVAFLPDGTMLVTERSGRLRIVRNGKLLSSPVAGVPPVQTGGPRGLQGLMDIALHPRFDENKWVYLAYHKPAGSGAGETVLARGIWNGTALIDVHNIFESGATDTEASRITFGPDGMLYMSISAPGSPNVQRSQDPNDYAGKTVRLRDDGSIPDDNPFVGRHGFKPGIFTSGHRNGHGLAVNPETGDLWETEQGPNGGDELNVLHAGCNYGWPLVSYGRDYWGVPHPFHEGMEDPIIVWLPSIAVTGMTFYTGERFPHWKRNLFVGGLREGGIPGTGQIQRIVFNEHWQELRREPMLMELKQRIRDIRQGPEGLLYVLTAEEDGALLKIEPR
jgi:glucose/arabinose dehydrogenase